MERNGVIELRYWILGDTGRYDCSDDRGSDERLTGGSFWISSLGSPFDTFGRSFCVSFTKNHVSILEIVHFILCLTCFPAK